MACLAVGSHHAHLLIEAAGGYREVLRFAGALKQFSSHRVREEMPGALWAKGGKPIAVRDAGHHRRVQQYIRRHAREGAWVWVEKRGAG